jgi:trans-aconitate methyltransferase
MEFIEQLKKLQLFKPDMTILDVGCHEGKFTEFFTQFGSVDAIDKYDRVLDKTKFNFTQINLEDFYSDKKYDLIFARNVFFFTNDPITQVVRYSEFLKPQGIFCLTLMGVDDPWTIPNAEGVRCTSVTRDQVSNFTDKFETLWFFEDTSEHPRMDGKGIKKWHLYKMILKKK